MKQIFSIVVFLLPLLFVSCKKDENLHTALIKSRTIVCDQCVETIKKAVYTLEGVKDVNVDLEAKTIEVKYLPLQTNIETIEIAITRAGYDANARKRDQEAYENLPDCCKNH